MKKSIFALLLLASSWNADADIFKCENPATGEIEFRDVPCSNRQVEATLPDTIARSQAGSRQVEVRAIEALVDEDRDDFQFVCEEELRGLSDDVYDERCERALRRQAECKIEASRRLPSKVHNAYVTALADGLGHDEAAEISRSRENWGDISTEDAMLIAMPVVEFTSSCIRRIFD